MQNYYGFFGLVIMVAMGAFFVWRKEKKRAALENADRKIKDLVFKKRAEAGDGPQAERPIDFFFYFDRRPDAKKALEDLAKMGLDVSEKNISLENSVSFQIVMKSDRREIETLEEKFEKIALSNKGVYDGWGCESVSQ